MPAGKGAERHTRAYTAMLPDAIMVFPGSLLERGAVIAALDGVVWSSYAMSDQRVVRLRLTAAGHAKVEELATAELEGLARLRPRFASVWDDLPGR